MLYFFIELSTQKCFVKSYHTHSQIKLQQLNELKIYIGILKSEISLQRSKFDEWCYKNLFRLHF